LEAIVYDLYLAERAELGEIAGSYFAVTVPELAFGGLREVLRELMKRSAASPDGWHRIADQAIAHVQ
jgi:hypothetical protein